MDKIRVLMLDLVQTQEIFNTSKEKLNNFCRQKIDQAIEQFNRSKDNFFLIKDYRFEFSGFDNGRLQLFVTITSLQVRLTQDYVKMSSLKQEDVDFYTAFKETLSGLLGDEKSYKLFVYVCGGSIDD